MKCYKALLMIAGLILAAAVWGQELPTYTCWKTSLVPLVDGDAADAAWSIAESTELFDVEDADRKQQHSRPTQVKMLWDDDNLYFLFTMVDPDVWSTFQNRDDQLYQEEVVEIFIDPDGDGLNYAEIEVNPLNVVFDLLLSKPWADGGQGFAQWNPEFASAVGIVGTINEAGDEDQGWTVEIALPWTALATDIRNVMNGQSLPPQSGDSWRLNLYRFERLREAGSITRAEASAWSTVGKIDFHRPDRFGYLNFGGLRAKTAVEPKSWGQLKPGQ